MELGGKTTVNEAVFQHIAEVVIKKIDDIADRKGVPAGFTKNLFARLTPQVVVTKEEQPDVDFGNVSFELKLAIIYGIKIPDVAAKVRVEFAKVVEELTGYKVTQVDIVFDRVVEMKELESPETDEK